jgi:hypothetical protein
MSLDFSESLLLLGAISIVARGLTDTVGSRWVARRVPAGEPGWGDPPGTV